MTAATTKTVFLRGTRAGAPFVLAVAPFALLFGVAATEAGLNLLQVMSMTMLVIAGAAQLTALAQMQDAAPVALVVAVALIVNLRMAMYSASLAPHLGTAPLWQRALAAYVLFDNTYALGVTEFEARPDAPTRQKMAYYLGSALPITSFWFLCTFIGAYLGQSIPPEWALDFAVPIGFTAMFAPMLRTLAHVAAALTSITAALALAFLPYGTGLIIAAGLAMIVGALVELRTQKS